MSVETKETCYIVDRKKSAKIFVSELLKLGFGADRVRNRFSLCLIENLIIIINWLTGNILLSKLLEEPMPLKLNDEHLAPWSKRRDSDFQLQ